MRRFSPYVYATTVRGYGLSEDDAQDVFQEVFLRTWRHLDDLQDDAAMRPWIAQLTRRLAIDRLRANARERARGNIDGAGSRPAPRGTLARGSVLATSGVLRPEHPET